LSKSNSDPSVSVVIPLFNKEKEVLRAVNSVLSQTINDFEVVVVNDGSTDKGPDLVRDSKDPRIKVIDQNNSGVSAARNRGITESRAELIAFLDADDEWKNNFLETIMYLKDKYPFCCAYATSYLYFDGNSYRAPLLKGLPKNFKEGILFDYFEIANQSDPPLCSSAIALKKDAINAIGRFPVNIKAGEDLLTWARLASRCDIAYSTQHCVVFWQDWTETQKHRRIPEVPDIIGMELFKLLMEPSLKSKSALRRYISLWHIMRASIAIQYGFNKLVIPELKLALKYSKPNKKILILFIFALLPGKISTHLFKKIMKFKRQLRKHIFKDKS
jgi:glycosyltransferase involved in cell wall biosynthesis